MRRAQALRLSVGALQRWPIWSSWPIWSYIEVRLARRAGMSALAAREHGRTGFVTGLMQTCKTLSSAAYTGLMFRSVVKFFSDMRVLSVLQAEEQGVPIATAEETELYFEFLFYLVGWSRRHAARKGRHGKPLRIVLSICNASLSWALSQRGVDNCEAIAINFRIHICTGPDCACTKAGQYAAALAKGNQAVEVGTSRHARARLGNRRNNWPNQEQADRRDLSPSRSACLVMGFPDSDQP